MLKRKPFKVKFYAYGAYREGVFTAHNDTEIKSLIQQMYGDELYNIYIMHKEEIDLFQDSVVIVKRFTGEE